MSMSIGELISQSEAVLLDVKNGDFVKAWRDSMPIQVAAQDMLLDVGFRTRHTTATTEKARQQLHSTWDAIEAECHKAQGVVNAKAAAKAVAAPPKEGEGAEGDVASVPVNPEVGKDGKIILGLAELFKNLAPLIALFL